MALDRFLQRASSSACTGRPKKAGEQALGRSRGGPTTKIHLICDAHGNPFRFHLTAGQVHDVTVAPHLLAQVGVLGEYVIADKGYDSDQFREKIRESGSQPVIPGRGNRKQPIEYDPELYKARSLIEHAFCHLKRFRAVATRYEKLARNFAGMVSLACIMLWLKL